MRHEELATAIGRTIGATLRARPASRVHGGSINECYRWEGDGGAVFIKVAPEHSGYLTQATSMLDGLLARVGR